MSDPRSTAVGIHRTVSEVLAAADAMEREALDLHRLARDFNRWGLCTLEAETQQRGRELRIRAMLERAKANRGAR